MSRPRLLVPVERWSERVGLEPAEKRHLVDSLRLCPDDRVEVFDGRGGLCQARLGREGGGWILLMGQRHTLEEDPLQVRLGLALLKGRKLDLVVRMLTELGVVGLRPFVCSRSVPRPDGSSSDKRLQRWRSIAAQAARQSGRVLVPRIEPITTFDQMVAEPPAGLRFLLHQQARGTDLYSLCAAQKERRRLMLIGPEGGFAPDELVRAERAGFRLVSMGLPVLQAQTAAVVAAAYACAVDLDVISRADRS